MRAQRYIPEGYEGSELFELRFKVSRYNWKTRTHHPVSVRIYAFEAPPFDKETGEPTGGRFGHTRVDIVMTAKGPRSKRARVIFPMGATYVGIPSHASIDGTYAKEAVASCVAMKPSDTDDEYFAGYTRLQRAFSGAYGDALQAEIRARYCDDEGNVKGERR